MKPKIKVQPLWNVVITDEFGTHGISEHATEQEALAKMQQFIDAGQAEPEAPQVSAPSANPAAVNLSNVKIEIRRKWETKQSIVSELYINGEQMYYDDQFFGLEPARVNPIVPGHPAIPAGEYKVVLSHSPRLGYVTPEVLNVPGRSGIRIHIGNCPKDVQGCLAVGLAKAVDMVMGSRVAFEKLMAILRNAKEITAVYKEDL